MPSVGCIRLMNAFDDSRSFWIFVTASPASSVMLYERSRTRATAARGLAIVSATMLITHCSPVSVHRTVTLPLAESPGVVEVYDSQSLVWATGRIGSEVTETLVPLGVPKPPVGPATMEKWSVRHVTTSNTIAR